MLKVSTAPVSVRLFLRSVTPGSSFDPIDPVGAPALPGSNRDPAPAPAHLGDPVAGRENDQPLQPPGSFAPIGAAAFGDDLIEPELGIALEWHPAYKGVGRGGDKPGGCRVRRSTRWRLDAGAGAEDGEDGEGGESTQPAV